MHTSFGCTCPTSTASSCLEISSSVLKLPAGVKRSVLTHTGVVCMLRAVALVLLHPYALPCSEILSSIIRGSNFGPALSVLVCFQRCLLCASLILLRPSLLWCGACCVRSQCHRPCQSSCRVAVRFFPVLGSRSVLHTIQSSISCNLLCSSRIRSRLQASCRDTRLSVLRFSACCVPS